MHGPPFFSLKSEKNTTKNIHINVDNEVIPEELSTRVRQLTCQASFRGYSRGIQLLAALQKQEEVGWIPVGFDSHKNRWTTTWLLFLERLINCPESNAKILSHLCTVNSKNCKIVTARIEKERKTTPG